jgi:hypothetical protein
MIKMMPITIAAAMDALAVNDILMNSKFHKNNNFYLT